MAQTSTVYTFQVQLSDVDRGVYEELSLPVARHPSESAEYMVTRVLAYALEFEEGITFTGGLSSGDDPAIWVRDLTGQLRTWIEVGTPDAARLHRASKAADRVVVYCHKDLEIYSRTLASEKVYAPDRVTIVEVPRALAAWLAERAERRTKLAISRTEGELYIDVGADSTTAMLGVHRWPGRG